LRTKLDIICGNLVDFNRVDFAESIRDNFTTKERLGFILQKAYIVDDICIYLL